MKKACCKIKRCGISPSNDVSGPDAVLRQALFCFFAYGAEIIWRSGGASHENKVFGSGRNSLEP